MSEPIQHGSIIGGVVATPDLDAALADYQGELGFALVEQGVVPDESVLQITHITIGTEAFDSADLAALGLNGQGQATANDAPIHLDGACTTNTVLATQV